MVKDTAAPPMEMWPYLAGFDMFTKELPIYVEKPFTDAQVSEIRNIIDTAKQTRPWAAIDEPNGMGGELYSFDRFDPKPVPHMSRLVVEFECPEDSEKIMDSYVLPLYKEEIKLAHYSYLDYDLKYGGGEFTPSLPPHIDGANTLVTFNYMLGGNIDWEIYVDNKPYDLKIGDALIFSAVNQVHWRPKRKWKEGEFVEILTFDYSLPNDFRFTGMGSPLDHRFYPEAIQAYMDDLGTKKEFVDAWELYDKLGLEINISIDKHGDFYNGESTDNN